MSRPLLMAALLLAASPAVAQQHLAVPLSPSRAQSRSFILRNVSHQAIVFARAYMTNGKSRALTYSPIEPGDAREVVVPRKECLASVAVQLNDGWTLKASHLDDCRSNQLVVGDQGIHILSADVQRLRRGKAPTPGATP